MGGDQKHCRRARSVAKHHSRGDAQRIYQEQQSCAQQVAEQPASGLALSFLQTTSPSVLPYFTEYCRTTRTGMTVVVSSVTAADITIPTGSSARRSRKMNTIADRTWAWVESDTVLDTRLALGGGDLLLVQTVGSWSFIADPRRPRSGPDPPGRPYRTRSPGPPIPRTAPASSCERPPACRASRTSPASPRGF